MRKNELYEPCVGVLIVYLKIVHSSSLKDRRRVVRSLLDRMRARWNVSAEDMGPDNEKTDVVLAVSAVGKELAAVEERLAAVYSFLCGEEESGEYYMVDSRQEVNRFEYFEWNKATTGAVPSSKNVLPHGEDQ